MDNHDPVIPLLINVTEFSTAVTGTVIHQNDLEIFVGLAADALYALFQIQFHIIDWHNHADHLAKHSFPCASSLTGSQASHGIQNRLLAREGVVAQIKSILRSH